jgi:hypothetical protein
MLKFAFAAGICAEWLLGPAVHSAPAFGFACARGFMYAMLAWIVLEGVRAVGKYVETFDDGR